MMKDETEVIGEETTSQEAANDVAMQSAVKADGRDWKGRILLVLALGAPLVARALHGCEVAAELSNYRLR